MIKNKVYPLIRSADIGYGYVIGPPMKMTLLDWDDTYVRVLWGGYPYRMERDLFEYLVYED